MFATNHPSLKGNYYYGEAGAHDDVAGLKKANLMISELVSSSIGIKMESYRFKMFFMCPHQITDDKVLEMVSDLKKVANDFCIYFRQTKFSDNVTFTVDEVVVMNDFNRSWNNDWCGWTFEINVKQFLDWDKCGIPT